MRDGTFSPAAGEFFGVFPRDEKVPVCLPRDGNGPRRWGAIWLTGRDESA